MTNETRPTPPLSPDSMPGRILSLGESRDSRAAWLGDRGRVPSPASRLLHPADGRSKQVRRGQLSPRPNQRPTLRVGPPKPPFRPVRRRPNHRGPCPPKQPVPRPARQFAGRDRPVLQAPARSANRPDPSPHLSPLPPQPFRGRVSPPYHGPCRSERIRSSQKNNGAGGQEGAGWALARWSVLMNDIRPRLGLLLTILADPLGPLSGACSC